MNSRSAFCRRRRQLIISAFPRSRYQHLRESRCLAYRAVVFGSMRATQPSARRWRRPRLHVFEFVQVLERCAADGDADDASSAGCGRSRKRRYRAVTMMSEVAS